MVIWLLLDTVWLLDIGIVAVKCPSGQMSSGQMSKRENVQAVHCPKTQMSSIQVSER